jgi:hypothetical protein
LGRAFFEPSRKLATGPRLRREGRAPYLHILHWAMIYLTYRRIGSILGLWKRQRPPSKAQSSGFLSSSIAASS